MKKLSLLLLTISLVIWAVGCPSNPTKQTNTTNPTNPTKSSKFTIAVIPKGTTHQFWKSINAGAQKAANDYKAQGVDVEIIWKGPLREDDREQQVQVVEGFISQR